jgi:2-dehydropantoate 2-reductase
MGQVPSAKPWLLIGSGRLATHLAHYLRQADIAFRQWSRSSGWHDVGGGGDGPPLADAAPACDRVLLAITDDALQGFVACHRRDGGPEWVHFSGSRRIEGAWSAHPLCTFGPELYAAAFYPTIPFVLEAEGPPLADLLPGLGNPEARVPAADRPLYHALCVAAGNFTTLLWQEFFAEIGRRWDMAPTLAHPYLERTAANLAAPGVAEALTGPIARRDLDTIRRNLEALDGAGLPHLADIYRAFLSAGRPVALETAA